MNRERAIYCIRLLMGCGMYLDFPPRERLLIFKRVMQQVVSV